MRIFYKGRHAEIDITSNSGDATDSFAESGQYIDGDERDLTDEELDIITMLYAGDIYEEYRQDRLENEIDRATDWYKDNY